MDSYRSAAGFSVTGIYRGLCNLQRITRFDQPLGAPKYFRSHTYYVVVDINKRIVGAYDPTIAEAQPNIQAGALSIRLYRLLAALNAPGVPPLKTRYKARKKGGSALRQFLRLCVH